MRGGAWEFANRPSHKITLPFLTRLSYDNLAYNVRGGLDSNEGAHSALPYRMAEDGELPNYHTDLSRIPLRSLIVMLQH